MNKKIDFTQQGGFPLTQDILKYLQDTFAENIEALLKLLGNDIIIEGARFNGSIFIDGLVIYNGELLPFVGGIGTFSGNPGSQPISVYEIGSELIFDDHTAKQVMFSRYVGLGSNGSNPKIINDLKSVNTYKKTTQMLFKSGVIDVANADPITITLGQNIDVTTLNPVVTLQSWQSATPDVKAITPIPTLLFKRGPILQGSAFLLEVQLGQYVNVRQVNKLVYHIFQDINSIN